VLRESIQKEIRQHLLTTRFVTCLALSLLLVVFGALVGSQEHRQRLEEHGKLASVEREKLSDIRVYSHIKPVASRKPTPLAVFNRGHSDRVGSSVAISHRSVPFLATGGGLENELLTLFPTFDLIDVVCYVLGLLALLLSFDAISGERENGTLRLIMANAVSRGRIAWAKYLSGIITLFIPLLLGFLVALLLLNIYSPIGLTGEEWLRVLLIVATAVLYLSAMYLVGLCLSALTRRSSTALMISMLVWLMFVLVIPNLSGFLASQAVEVETTRSLQLKKASLEEEAAHLVSQYESGLPPSQVMGDLSIYGVDGEVLVRLGRPERYAWLNDSYTYLNRTELRYADRIWDIRRDHLHRLARQSARAYDFSGISPAFMADAITQKLAGTSLEDHEDFMEATRTYRGEIISYIEARGGFDTRRWFTDDPPDQKALVLDPETFDRNRMDMERAWAMLAAAEQDRSRILNLSDMPWFRFYPATVFESVGRASGDLASLAGLNIFLFVFFLWAFSRYDCR